MINSNQALDKALKNITVEHNGNTFKGEKGYFENLKNSLDFLQNTLTQEKEEYLNNFADDEKVLISQIIAIKKIPYPTGETTLYLTEEDIKIILAKILLQKFKIYQEYYSNR